MTPELPFNDRFVWTDWNQLVPVPDETTPTTSTTSIPTVPDLQGVAERAAARESSIAERSLSNVRSPQLWDDDD